MTTLVVVALAVGVSASAAAPAAASPSVAAVCSATLPLNLSPGLQLLRRTQGTNQSFGETGTLSCIGTLDRFHVAGPGTIGFVGPYNGTCSAATGDGTWSFTIPVDDNGVRRLIHHSGTYSAPNVGLVIAFNGIFETGRLGGAGAVIPVQGNCLTQALTKATFPMLDVQLTQ